jgi:microbial collagenase
MNRMFRRIPIVLIALCALPFARWAMAEPAPAQAGVDIGVAHDRAGAAPMPRQPSAFPRTPQQWRYDLAPSSVVRPELLPPAERASAEKARTKAVGDCQDMQRLAGYRGAALGEYVAAMPDPDCLTPLFSVAGPLATAIFAPENLDGVAARFVLESAAYRSAGGALVNLALFLRAAYYRAATAAAAVPPSVAAMLRPAVTSLVSGDQLFRPNPAAPTTAGEVVTLIVNMHDEAAYLDIMKARVAAFTNSWLRPNAAQALRDPNTAYGYTAVLKVFYFAHYRPDAVAKIENDPSYATTLYDFVRSNKRSLLGDAGTSYQLNQTATEAFRFAMHQALLPTVSVMLEDALANSTMAGKDRLIWLAAAQAVEQYDNANCSRYGTCNFEPLLADAILSRRYRCPSLPIRLRTQDLTQAQANTACATLAQETPYFHAMLNTHGVPVADDYNDTLEVVVFANNTEYENYSGVLFGNATNNGGEYIEGNPASRTNQARFIAFRATWLPQFEIWNLRHEYVHYLDGRYDMYGDFDLGTRVPTVWYIEGLAEYIALGNDNQKAIDVAKTGQYRLSQIFRNTYQMDDYVDRAYRWGYMAVRFVFERRPELLGMILPLFRSGDYERYWDYMQRLSTQIDDEFAAWVPTATTAGSPHSPWQTATRR